jgi:hypothetical protein
VEEENMLTNTDLIRMLVAGAVNGVILALIAYAAPRFTRQILYGVLVFAAAMYVVFAYNMNDSAPWFALELLGLVIYGAIGYRGLKGSPLWLAAGWVAHPLWDAALHFFGPGRPVAPVNYTIPCITYDFAVAAVIVWKTLGARASRSQSALRFSER